ncbi:hypothetical protein [Burkholderia reimsis]|uniref:hypothetical protein n=1 Tax=Burkholderia reimsis TaxID=2234132 RepID=UPI0014027854|nr:hypothetical protein [Burkholderia reimsis]
MSFRNLPVVMAGVIGLVVFQSGLSHTAVGQGASGFVVNAVLLVLAARMLK